MKKVSLNVAELERMAEIIQLPLFSEEREAIRAQLELWINDNNDLMEEMMKPEYDALFPASIVSHSQ